MARNVLKSNLRKETETFQLFTSRCYFFCFKIESPQGDGNLILLVYYGKEFLFSFKIESPQGDGNIDRENMCKNSILCFKIESPQGDGNPIKFPLESSNVKQCFKIESPQGDGNRALRNSLRFHSRVLKSNLRKETETSSYANVLHKISLAF